MTERVSRGDGAEPVMTTSSHTPDITKTSSVRRTFYKDALLPQSLQCIHPRLRDAVEVNDRATLLQAAELLLDYGTPQEVASRLASTQQQREEPPSVGLCAGADDSLPLAPACASPNKVYLTFYDALEELQHRCDFFLSTFTDGVESYHVPCDVQRRVVPLLYAWLVDWDFLQRDTNCWVRVAVCFWRVIQSRRRRFTVRPDFSLPWRPLVMLLLSLFFQSDRVMDLHMFHGMREAAGRQLDCVCECAALHFDEDAWMGLWETLGPYFSPEHEEAPLMLCLFSHLIPIHHFVDKKNGQPLPMTERFVRFLLSDSLYWQQGRSGNWMAYSLKIVFEMALHHVGVMDFDQYAEPLFSMMLYALRLPIADGTGSLQSPLGFGVLSKIPFFRIDEQEMAAAEGFVANMLPSNTDSPLWNHLRRFVLATSVFIRPNATDRVVLCRVFRFYSSLVAAVHRRMKVQSSQEHLRMGRRKRPFEGRSIPDAYIWKQETVDSFVNLVAPVLLSSLHHGLRDAARTIGLLTSLSPKLVHTLILPYVDAGVQNRMESPLQRSVALRLLIKSLYSLSECRATREDCWSFLADVLPSLLPWVNANDVSLLLVVLDLIFTTCSIVSLKKLLGGQEAECGFAVTLVERLFECSSHLILSKAQDLGNLVHVMKALCQNVSDETFNFCVTKALKEAQIQDVLSKASVVSCLLEPIAHRAPERIMRWAMQSLIPPIQNALTPESEVQWCVHLLAGCVRGAGLAGFSYRHDILRCLQFQLTHITDVKHITALGTLYSAMFSAYTETVCIKAHAVPLARSGDEVDNDVNDSDESEYEESQDVYEVSIGFCRSNSVEMTWREASEEHIDYVINVYWGFVQDIVDVIHGITDIVPPATTGSSEGLRHFLRSNSNHNSNNDHKNNTNTNRNSNSSSSSSSGSVNNPTESNNEKKSDSSEVQDKLESDDDSHAFTPEGVLRGVLLWLRIVLEINQELRVGSKTESTSNMVPWWTQNPKTTWSWETFSFASKVSSLPPKMLSTCSQDAIHDMLLEHVLRRVVGDVADEKVIATALQLQHSVLMRGKPPLKDTRQGAHPDGRGLRSVLAILAEQCNISVGTPLRYDHSRPHTQTLDMFSSGAVETPRGRHYFPVMYWRLKAESFIASRRVVPMYTIPPKRLMELISITHTLLFSPYQMIQLDCYQILSECMSFMGREATCNFIKRHLILLERIAGLWRKGHGVNDQDTPHQNLIPSAGGSSNSNSNSSSSSSSSSNVAAPAAATAMGIDIVDTVSSPDGHEDTRTDATTQTKSTTNDGMQNSNSNGNGNMNVNCSLHGEEDEKYVADSYDGYDDTDRNTRNVLLGKEGLNDCSSMLKSELVSALTLAYMRFNSPHFFSDSDLILNTYEVLTRFPEQLRTKRLGIGKNTQKAACFAGFPRMENARVVQLSDELLSLAVKFSHSAPERALSCLIMIVALYRPSQVSLLSLQSVTTLFRLSVNGHEKLRATSFHILQTLLLSLKVPHEKRYVLMRCAPMEAKENVSFFRNRYEILMRNCPSFYGLGEVGLVFPPKAIRVDAECITPNMFHDEEAITISSEDGVLRKDYTERVLSSDTQEVQKLQQRREDYKALIGHLSGILDEEINPLVTLGQEKELEVEAKLREGWIWTVVQLRHDQKSFSQCRMRVWKIFGNLLGVEPTVRMFTRIVRMGLQDFMNLTTSDSTSAKESQQWLFSCLSDLLIAAIRTSKRDPVMRREALSCYIETIMVICTKSVVPHDVLEPFLQSVSALHDTLKREEVWLLYASLFEALEPPSEKALRGATAVGMDGDVPTTPSASPWWSGRTQEFVRILSVTAQLLFVFAADINIELLPRLCQHVLANKDLFLYTTSTRIRRYSSGVIRQIMRLCLNQSEYIPSNVDVQNSIVTFMDCIEQIVELPSLPAAEPIPSLAPWSETPALVAAPNPFMALTDASSDMVTTYTVNTTAVTAAAAAAAAASAATLTAATPDVVAPSATVALPVSPLGALSPALVCASSPLCTDAFSLDGTRVSSPSMSIAAVKTIAMYWLQPPPPIISLRIKIVTSLLARALDILSSEADDLEMVRLTLDSIAYVRQPKETIHGIVVLLCEILEEKKPYGRSKQAKIILCRMLRLILFINLHRIGRYTIMQDVLRAAIQSIAHGDGRTRGEGRLLLAVLTRVASEEQTKALIHGCFLQLRELSSTAVSTPGATTTTTTTTVTTTATNTTTTSGSTGVCSINNNNNSNNSCVTSHFEQEHVRKRKRIALLLALCSILSATPGVVPPYIPRLMERLAAHANDTAPEVQRAIKRAFEDWWRSHRDGWELEHKQHFTPAQIEVMLPLLTAPVYLV